jgi:hypothetical protein
MLFKRSEEITKYTLASCVLMARMLIYTSSAATADGLNLFSRNGFAFPNARKRVWLVPVPKAPGLDDPQQTSIFESCADCAIEARRSAAL